MGEVKKNLLILFLMLSISILFSSCLFDLKDKNNQKGQVSINLKNIMTSGISKNYNGEEIKVIVELENTVTKQKFTAIAGKDYHDKKEMVFDKIPYGAYTVTISLYNYGNSEPYSIIREDLVVGSGTASKVGGVVGAPNKVTDLNGVLEYYENEEGYHYLNFECNKVTSNLLSDSTGDDITYKLYGSFYPDFRNSELLITVNPEDSRHPKQNSGANKVVLKSGKFNSSSDSEVPEGISNNGTYYWRIVTENSKGSIESKINMIINRKKVESIDNSPNIVTNDEREPLQNDGTNPFTPSYGFRWKHVTSVSGDPTFNNITYKLHISKSSDFPVGEDTKIINQNISDPSGGWIQGGTDVIVVPDTSLEYGYLLNSNFLMSGMYYWKVEAINSAGSSMSDVWEFGIY